MANALSSAQELSCPNCGAPAQMPAFGNAIQCEYCGTRFFLHTPAAQIALPPNKTVSNTSTLSEQDSSKIRQWVKWLVIFIVVVTVVPTVCGILASVCGVFGAFVPVFVR